MVAFNMVAFKGHIENKVEVEFSELIASQQGQSEDSNYMFSHLLAVMN